ncbi:hypothetical protein D3C72_1538770 [compost metagenome]
MARINATAQDLANTGNHQINRNHIAVNAPAVHAQQLFRYAWPNRQNTGSHCPADEQRAGTQEELASGSAQAIRQRAFFCRGFCCRCPAERYNNGFNRPFQHHAQCGNCRHRHDDNERQRGSVEPGLQRHAAENRPQSQTGGE